LQAPNQAAVPMFSGKTDRDGNLNVSFQVPTDAALDQQLIVETRSDRGMYQAKPPIVIKRDYRILLTTDKPIYQPGQTIHLRALALSTSDTCPGGQCQGRSAAAQQPIEISIADGKGNRVFRQTVTASDYGVAFTDFQLANEVNTGPYKITAQLGDMLSEKTVEVKYYVLPKFAIDLKIDRTYYQPGATVHGTLSANYFFGKPVSQGQVKIEGYTFDVERTSVINLDGQTTANGDFEFSFDLPKYIAGSDLENGQGRFYVQASVIDQAQHTEVTNLSLPVTAQPIAIQAIPEGGKLQWDFENVITVLTSAPDGTPLATDLTVLPEGAQTPLIAHTDDYGLAEVRVKPSMVPQRVYIHASAANGAQADSSFTFEARPTGDGILLRTDKPIYRVGETMSVTVLSTGSQGTFYLDLVRSGQTASTRAVPFTEGRAQVAIDLTPDLNGTLEVHAYRITRDGQIVRDTRLILVDDATELGVAVKPDRDVYRPGDQAQLDVAVTDQKGAGTQAALGLAIVDESVFALAEQDPGFARLYFLLEQELLQPKYDLHGFRLMRSMAEPAQETALRNAQDVAARAALAQAVTTQADFSLNSNTHNDVSRDLRMRQGVYFGGLSNWLSVLSVIMSGAVVWYGGVSLHRRQRLAFSFLLVIFLIIGLFMLSGSRMYELYALILFALGATLVIGFLVMISLAVNRKDQAFRRAIGLMGLNIGLLILIGFTYARSYSYGFDLELIALIGLALMIVMYFMLLFGEMTSGCGTQLLLLGLVFALIISAGCAPAATPAAPMMMAVPAPTQAPAQEAMQRQASAKQGSAAEEPRLRQYFPETMLWLPDAVTDQNGQLKIDVPIADSITTWRVTALASTRDGRIGSTTSGLRVFQDFFVDLDLPVALTVGDEIAVPIGVYNYLSETQTVRLELAPADWYDLRDSASKSIEIAGNDVSVVYFRVRAKSFGLQPFKVTAYGSKLSDAIQKMVRVLPNGKAQSSAQSDRLENNTTIQRTVSIPVQAIPGTQAITVKIYPGIVSQVVEGLDSILRMPNGCFEQTSSSAYPNALVLDYLQQTKQASPEVQMKAEEYINLGYQRLTTFEVPGGGFSLFGRDPADRMLTAYGLQEFSDMRRVHDVDPALIQRAAEWLLSQQQTDGSWENDRGLVHESSWSNLKNNRLPVTAYIVWSLMDAGFGNDARTQRGLAYVREHRGEAEDAYVMALVANALVAADRSASGPDKPFTLSADTQEVLNRLSEISVKKDNAVMWPSSIATFMGSQGETGSIETTALATLALLRGEVHPDVANGGLTALIKAKDANGTWYTTQTTILALKALLQSLRVGSENVNAAIAIKLDGGAARTVKVTAENFDVVQAVTFNDLTPGQGHTIEIATQGEGNLMYQIAANYYLPWSAVPRSGDQGEAMSIGVKYDRTQLQMNDNVTVNVDV
ncbi:MAG TPA: MG2 domain-containing protein, partial [Anaerolineae bacterium]|nr:MG2 domain-containing protein [Anaerolineae bacterium]